MDEHGGGDAIVARASKVEQLRFQGPVMEQLIEPFQMRQWGKIHREYLVEGPTGTGKSVGIGGLVKVAARMFDNANILVLRYVKTDLAGSFMKMWEEQILDPNDRLDEWMRTNGTMAHVPSYRSRDFYRYPNGSTIWCRGMDQWSRFKSMEFDLIWCMEMTEFEEGQIDGLHTRLRARSQNGKTIPFGRRFLIGDVNPVYPQHWCNQRPETINEKGERVSHRITTSLKDNPGFYDRRVGDYTEVGQDYLDNVLSQIRDPAERERNIRGIWAASTGQILDWDDRRNRFKGRVERKAGRKWEILLDRTHPILGDRVELTGIGASYDWGKRHAGTLQIWGVCDKGRQYLLEEVYHSKKPLLWWAEWVVHFWKKYDLPWVVCDNAASDSITYFNHRLEQEGGGKARIAIECDKRSGNKQQSNMEVLIDLFCDQADGKPGVYVREEALAHAPDMELKSRKFADEVPQYVYAEYEPGRHKGRPEDRPDRGCTDDGLDACTYFRVQMLGGRKLVTKVNIREGLSDRELMDRHYWNEKVA